MKVSKREFLRMAGAASAGTVATLGSSGSAMAQDESCNDPFAGLNSMIEGVKPISLEERLSRIEKAQKLMVDNGIDAMFLDAGTSMEYFTGVRWGQSERMLAAIIPAKGDIKYVSPGFEEAKLNELMTIGSDVRTWEEHESPYKRVAQILDDVGAARGTVAMEERVRFFCSTAFARRDPIQPTSAQIR